jgi:MoxR-like ATPase
MNNEKIKAVMNEIASETAERDELIQCIAIALLAKKNLFILGDTGQGKSHCINLFRKRITGAKQFERLMSKQTDEEQLFGRLDLSSIIPGNMPHSELIKDTAYSIELNEVKKAYNQFVIDAKQETLDEAEKHADTLDSIKKILCSVNENTPKVITTGKIPDSHIVFLDEVFKSNDGILNSLLTALNERVYTNEGQTIPIPTISFFSASNEIPDFSEPENEILKPLYDRFDLKLVTEYVNDKDNRQAILKKKQSPTVNANPTTITLKELVDMQNEVKLVKIPDSINELMDDILCTLRRKEIHISDRKFFNYALIVQAAAYIRGGDTVSVEDLMILKNYFWTTPAEISTISDVLTEICDNPIKSRIDDLIAMADEAFEDFKTNSANNRAFTKVRAELIKVYSDLQAIECVSDTDRDKVREASEQLEALSKQVYETKRYTVVPLSEAYAQQL